MKVFCPVSVTAPGLDTLLFLKLNQCSWPKHEWHGDDNNDGINPWQESCIDSQAVHRQDEGILIAITAIARERGVTDNNSIVRNDVTTTNHTVDDKPPFAQISQISFGDIVQVHGIAITPASFGMTEKAQMGSGSLVRVASGKFLSPNVEARFPTGSCSLPRFLVPSLPLSSPCRTLMRTDKEQRRCHFLMDENVYKRPLRALIHQVQRGGTPPIEPFLHRASTSPARA